MGETREENGPASIGTGALTDRLCQTV